MNWQKGDLVYIPSMTPIIQIDWNHVDYDQDGEPISAGASAGQSLAIPSHAIVLDEKPFLNMRKLFIANDGIWYVDKKNIYNPRRKENGEVKSSCSRERNTRRCTREACCT